MSLNFALSIFSFFAFASNTLNKLITSDLVTEITMKLHGIRMSHLNENFMAYHYSHNENS